MAWTGLGKRLREIFQSREFDGEFFNDLEDALIEADIGVRLAGETIEALKETARKDGIRSRDGLRDALKALLRTHIVSSDIVLVPDALNVLLVLGVNGVGKTTTIAKEDGTFGPPGVSRAFSWWPETLSGLPPSSS